MQLFKKCILSAQTCETNNIRLAAVQISMFKPSIEISTGKYTSKQKKSVAILRHVTSEQIIAKINIKSSWKKSMQPRRVIYMRECNFT